MSWHFDGYGPRIRVGPLRGDLAGPAETLADRLEAERRDPWSGRADRSFPITVKPTSTTESRACSPPRVYRVYTVQMSTASRDDGRSAPCRVRETGVVKGPEQLMKKKPPSAHRVVESWRTP